MNAQPETFGDEFCPRCGKWVTTLEALGWCSDCTLETGRRCTRCHEMLPLNHYARDKARIGVQGGRRPVCRACDTARRRLREAEKRLQTGRIGPGRVNGPAPVATSSKEATVTNHTPRPPGVLGARA